MAREKKHDETDGLELVHPVYLDVPMLVSFVAAVEGGVAFGSEETEKGATAQDRSREVAGRTKAGFPLLGALVGMDASGRYGRRDQEQESKETKIVRQHTEASLFNLLRHELEREGRITMIESKDQLEELEVGQLVEISGEIVGNPLEQMLELFLQILPYLGYDVEELTKPKKQKQKQANRENPRSGNPARRAAANESLGNQGGGNQDELSQEDIFGLFATMRQDLDKSSIRDLVLLGEKDLRAVLTLSTEFLTGTAAEYLLGGRFSVVGKLTRVLNEGESINLTRRTALGLGGPALVRGMVNDLRGTESLSGRGGDQRRRLRQLGECRKGFKDPGASRSSSTSCARSRRSSLPRARPASRFAPRQPPTRSTRPPRQSREPRYWSTLPPRPVPRARSLQGCRERGLCVSSAPGRSRRRSQVSGPDQEPEEPLGRHGLTALPYEFGQNIDWEADLVSVILFVELPFWLMTPSYTFNAEVEGCTYTLDVIDYFAELFRDEATDSRKTSLYIGPRDYEKVQPAIREELERQQIATVWRPCKSVVRIHSRANSDALDAAADLEGAPVRSREAQYYLQALCEAHLPILNRLIQGYRLHTYDLFAHEVSPWDVPVWYVHRAGAGSERMVLFDYATWDRKPQIGPMDGDLLTYRLTIPPDLQHALDTLTPTPGELELIDALNLMERGDYTGAVRRVTTAIEAVVEDELRKQLATRYSDEEVEKRLTASRNDFPGRVRQYCKLSGRQLPEALSDDLDRTRSARHQIVHRAHRVTYADRGSAQRSVDTGRWTFNWFENRPDRRDVREQLIATRSLGRHMSFFEAELTPEGVVVLSPWELPLEDQDAAPAPSSD